MNQIVRQRNRQIRSFRRKLAQLLQVLDTETIPEDIIKWVKNQVKKI